MSLIMWAVGIVFGLCSILAYVELGTMLPRSGGEKEYLDYEYRKPRTMVPFMFCLTLCFLTRPGSCAADSIVVGTHWDPWAEKAIGVGVITLCCLIHACSTTWGLRINNALTVVKTLVLVFIAITGIVVAAGGAPHVPNTHNFENVFAGTSQNGNGYASALIKVAFTVGSGNNVNYILDELKDPIRTLKVSAAVSFSIITVLYMVVNAAYFIVVPKAVMLASSTTVAAEFCTRVFGPASNSVLPALIALSAFGATSTITVTSGRVIMEAARDGYFPYGSVFGRPSSFSGAPTWAFLIHWLATTVLIVGPPSGVYNFFVDVAGYPLTYFTVLAVVGMLWLRKTEPEKARPFRAPLATSILLILYNIFLIIFPFVPTVESDSDLPYWLYPVIGIAVIALTAVLWYIRMVWFGGLHRAL
ncbi:amino acid/polyamine transporter I [Syncephalastrum racemosum]|uniref:Amino acid/polyamine transporter I n=1 Tax=Syncephalastrum racemosum TaxID=13706 RepID=A0A1X2H5W4_SYNRA|nr:amino acid/polyamine transporter I [Syncephalastrum racemosum]